MLLYLVRHAIAFDHDPQRWPDDRERPLTGKGIKKFRAAVEGLRAVAPPADVVLSSRFVRAWQTADILRKEAGWPAPIACEALEQGHEPVEALVALQSYASASSVALVGHEPSMGELASFLLTGERGRAKIEFKKGGVACFQMEGGLQAGTATLQWLATPRLLRSLDAD